MFGIFKKNKEAAKPNPETAKMAERINEQTEIAELQSRISELRRQSAQMNAEIARKQEERAGLMAKIQSVPPAQKTALALRVKNIDKFVAGLNGNLALIEQQIGNIESTLLQKGATVVVDAGDIGGVVDATAHRGKLRDAKEKKEAGDINVQIADEMFAELTGGATSNSGDIADILAEAEGTSPTVSAESIATHTPDHTQSSHLMPTSQL